MLPLLFSYIKISRRRWPCDGSSSQFKWAASDASEIESLYDDGHCFHLPSDGYSYPQIQDCTGALDQFLIIGFAQCQ
jgi:hypothetical protein